VSEVVARQVTQASLTANAVVCYLRGLLTQSFLAIAKGSGGEDYRLR
jgi:hypothetical protein